jgi:hypothetical protein
MVLEIESAIPPPTLSPTPAAARPPQEPPGESFSQVLGVLGSRVDQGEALMGGVAAGSWSSSDPGTLIALQAGIYRYSEVVDLAGKLVDRASTAVRTVLQAGH